jgi:hypothetical protein
MIENKEVRERERERWGWGMSQGTGARLQALHWPNQLSIVVHYKSFRGKKSRNSE